MINWNTKPDYSHYIRGLKTKCKSTRRTLAAMLFFIKKEHIEDPDLQHLLEDAQISIKVLESFVEDRISAENYDRVKHAKKLARCGVDPKK